MTEMRHAEGRDINSQSAGATFSYCARHVLSSIRVSAALSSKQCLRGGGGPREIPLRCHACRLPDSRYHRGWLVHG